MLPHILPFALDEEVHTGDSAQLTCHVSKGDRPLSIEWEWAVHGQPVRPGSAVEGVEVLAVNEKTSILTITSASAEHSGDYTCRASNRAGSATHTAPVHVNGTNPSSLGVGLLLLLLVLLLVLALCAIAPPAPLLPSLTRPCLPCPAQCCRTSSR